MNPARFVQFINDGTSRRDAIAALASANGLARIAAQAGDQSDEVRRLMEGMLVELLDDPDALDRLAAAFVTLSSIGSTLARQVEIERGLAAGAIFQELGIRVAGS